MFMRKNQQLEEDLKKQQQNNNNLNNTHIIEKLTLELEEKEETI